MKMTKLEAQIKASQKAYEYRHHGRSFRTEVPNFEQWFLAGIRKYEEMGAEFELIETGMVKIRWPGKTAILRTVEDFRAEYNSLITPIQAVA
jgi:hypothetical protein